MGQQATPTDSAPTLEEFPETEFPFDVVDAPYDWAEWLPLLTVILLTLVLLPWVVRRLRRNGQQPEEELASAAVEAPDPRADMELRLQGLQQLSVTDEMECRLFFEQAAAALRRYLIEAWQFPADRQTSEESLLAWQQTELDDEALRLLLQLCDGSKFALRQADAEDVRQWLQKCRRFVEVGR